MLAEGFNLSINATGFFEKLDYQLIGGWEGQYDGSPATCMDSQTAKPR